MFNFSVNDQEYSCIDKWEELTITKAVEMKVLADNLSTTIKNNLLHIIKPSMERRELSSEDTEALNRFWQEIFLLASDINKDIVEHIVMDDILELCNSSLMGFILSVLFTPLYEPKGIEYFDWNGETLFLPESGTDIIGITTPLEKLKSKEFCEASDVNAVNDLSLAPLFVAILCRPKGEEYNEERVKMRAKTMQTLTMDIYLEVFFCLVQLTNISLENTLSVIQEEKKKMKRKK